jgi:large subunit ribosomal protein L3
MIQGLIGKKIGMTQFFKDDGTVVPVTVIKAGPCIVTQIKKKENNPYNKIQVGLVEEKTVKNITKPMQGHFKKNNIPPTRILREFFINEENLNIGDTIKADIFAENEKVSIIGDTKGKGFQGVVRRWNFAGGKGSHGSMFHRRPGSVGMCAYPGKVIKGKKLPGRMGGNRKNVKGLKIEKIDLENNLVWIKGAVPGFNGNYLYIMKGAFKRS